MMKACAKKAVALAVGVALGGLAQGVFAGGFGIGTQSGSGVGNAFSGGAAVADDASVVWSNPAGMAFLPSGKQVTGALHILRPSFKFRNEGSTGAYAAPGTGDGGDGGGWAFVPNGFFAMDINPQWRFGVALNVPFGLTTEYDSGWRGQLTGIKSEIKTLNINPSVAYKLNDTVSIGGGLSLQKIEAELTSFAGGAGVSTLSADDIGYGFNLGLMAQVSPATRLGFWKKLCAEEGLDPFPAAAGSKRVEEILRMRLSTQMREFPGYAQVRRVAATLDPWTVENGLLTPTMKLKRAKVMEKFNAEIDKMYAGH